MNKVERKQFPALDIAKFIMAMFILTQHTCNEWAHSTGLVHAFFGVGNFAVPFFFACSGFLFFSKYNKLDSEGQSVYYKKWSVRIGKMYLVWSSIYFIFVFCSWLGDDFTWIKPFIWLHRAIVYSTYATIWFLPALWLGLSICVLSKRFFSHSTTVVTMVILYVIGNLFGSYDNVVTKIPAIQSFYDWYMSIFVTWRNGVFNGAPFVFIGLMITDKKSDYGSYPMNIFWTAFFCIAFIAEAFCIITFKLGHATDMGFFMAPAIYFLMKSLVETKIEQRQVWIHCRNLSMLVFLGQRLFLSAIPGIWPAMSAWIAGLPQVMIYLYFIAVTLLFSFAIERLSTRYKFLKILW